MNPLSYIIAAAVLIGFAVAIIVVMKSNRGSCGSCAGCMYRNECHKAEKYIKKEGL